MFDFYNSIRLASAISYDKQHNKEKVLKLGLQ